MPNLDHESSLQFWQHFMGGAVYDTIEFLEKNESWTLADHESIQEQLATLGQELDKGSNTMDFDLTSLIRICSLLHMSQKLRIMQCVDAIKPGTATRMISASESASSSDELAKIFLQRNMIFERTRILQRILSPDRLQKLRKLYEK